MSEPSRTDLSALLRTLREQAAEPRDGVRLRDTGLIQRISDRAASLAAPARPPTDAPATLRALREQSSQLSNQARFHDVGTVQHIGNGVATLSGLPRARTDELVTFPTGVQGLILNLDRTRHDVILLGPEEGIQGGDLVTQDGERLRVPVDRKSVV